MRGSKLYSVIALALSNSEYNRTVRENTEELVLEAVQEFLLNSPTR